MFNQLRVSFLHDCAAQIALAVNLQERLCKSTKGNMLLHICMCPFKNAASISPVGVSKFRTGGLEDDLIDTYKNTFPQRSW
jgi:hypothetical protein